MKQPTTIQLIDSPPVLHELDFSDATINNKAKYQKQLKTWQLRLLQVQQAYYHQKRRAVIVFEGWDASGKGGAIRRLTERLDPRGFAVHPIGAPTSEEKSQHYLCRFQNRLPSTGSIAIFDRSWYGRVLVERIEALAEPEAWQRAYQEINEFERMLSDDNIRIVKFFLHITPQEQLKRFCERLETPTKRWKLTHEDIRNRKRWPDYEVAINDMLHYTSTNSSHWHVIAANHKWYTRIAVLKHVVKTLEAGIDITPPPIDPVVLQAAKKELGLDITESD